MELILINSARLKIILNEEDMKQYSISKCADQTDRSTGRAIRSLLDQAKKEVGFNTEGDEIFVQLYTSKKGGCELFITKTSYEGEDATQKKSGSEERLLRDVRACNTEKALTPIQKERGESRLPEKNASLAYSFESLEALLRACSLLLSRKNNYFSLAAHDKRERYYLILRNVGICQYSRLGRLTFLNEFGTREDPKAIESYISEHCRFICQEKAIETLGALL